MQRARSCDNGPSFTWWQEGHRSAATAISWAACWRAARHRGAG